MIFYLPLECKQKVVENIHGADWEDLSVNEIDDCLLELLNVAAGNFVNNYYGESVPHNLSFPHIRFDESEIDYAEKTVDYYYDAEGETFRVALYTES